ncbi:MAG: glycoside hydrolase family 2 [Clostridia bacterium]|nr:glycoside hydrolase family 2 [Clostridia bacterium]
MAQLKTEYILNNGGTLSTPFLEAPYRTWEEVYPRPTMVRGEDTYRILNGIWKLSRRNRRGELCEVGEICMPFSPESALSGIESTLRKGERWLYTRSFRAPMVTDGHVLLHLPQIREKYRITVNAWCSEWMEGSVAGSTHEITAYLMSNDSENRISIEVCYTADVNIPYGKQRGKRGGMWYTPTTGIRGTVWVETVPGQYAEKITVTPSLNDVTIAVSGFSEEAEKTLLIETEQGEKCVHFVGSQVTVALDQPHRWTPDDPFLYPFTLTCAEDCVKSYFALRTFGIRKVGDTPYLCLNGEPYFFHGLLDQGYYPDGIDLPASPDAYRFDVMTAKELGFRMLRKHAKLEDPYFYYTCDVCGMVVFADMVNNGRYVFLRDTALPTVGIRHGIRRFASQRQRQMFLSNAEAAVQCLYHHPSVAYYTIFNEGWGQFSPDEVYLRLRTLDPTRIWDTTSGWFFGRKSDVQSEHVYFRALDLKPRGEKPLVLSEFGGYSLAVNGHMYCGGRIYGYKKHATAEELAEALKNLYLVEVNAMIARGLCASVLTQLTDVEDEVNGLITYDRRVMKVDASVMQPIAQTLKKTFEEILHGERAKETDR